MALMNRKEEATLYYLYMMADGEVSYSEEKLFDEICRELEVDTDTKNLVIKNCKELTAGTTNMFSIIIREKIDEQAGQNWFGLRNLSSRARIIWNLINLGHADACYSKEEEKIVNYLIDKWDISTEVYQEFVDIADTMLALTKHKEWIQKTFHKGSARDKKEKEVDTEMKQLTDDVKLTIKEITM